MDYNLEFIDIYENIEKEINKIDLSKYIKRHLIYSINHNYITDCINNIKNSYYIECDYTISIFPPFCNSFYRDIINNKYNFIDIIIKNNNNIELNLSIQNIFGNKYNIPIIFKNEYINFRIGKYDYINLFTLISSLNNYDIEIYYKVMDMPRNMFLSRFLAINYTYNFNEYFDNITMNNSLDFNIGNIDILFNNNNNYIDIHKYNIKNFVKDYKFNLNIKLLYNKFEIKIETNYNYNLLNIIINNNNLIKSKCLYKILKFLLNFLANKLNISFINLSMYLLYNDINFNSVNEYILYKKINNL